MVKIFGAVRVFGAFVGFGVGSAGGCWRRKAVEEYSVNPTFFLLG